MDFPNYLNQVAQGVGSWLTNPVAAYQQAFPPPSAEEEKRRALVEIMGLTPDARPFTGGDIYLPPKLSITSGPVNFKEQKEALNSKHSSRY